MRRASAGGTLLFLDWEIGRFPEWKAEISKLEIGRSAERRASAGRTTFLELGRHSDCHSPHAMDTNHKKADELHQRLIQFGARTTQVANALPKTPDGRHISQQLLRSGMAAAANYAEARGGESRNDFIHKLRVALKELNETRSWLQQIAENGLFSRAKLEELVAENQELCWIIAASIRTARRNGSRPI